ncbi:TetR/AcrR family transcriptional regulator [Sulfitobacter sp. JB4-11]|uniref:TetR/AcrR family transcriptional regulator n=1 Tax=Sulfitobacter rhodophyticola TaxID=3238304 RepID=UPI0035160E60
MATSRLTKADWLHAGFDALKAKGPHALAAEPLARRMGTTKGSFYWHYKDVPAYHAALLAKWRTDALEHVVDLLNATGPADQQLRDFGQSVLGDEVEASLRIWAQTNSHVADILAEVDMERLGYLVHLLRKMGLRNENFARALQATLIGLPQYAPDAADVQADAFDTLVDTVLALN